MDSAVGLSTITAESGDHSDGATHWNLSVELFEMDPLRRTKFSLNFTSVSKTDAESKRLLFFFL